MIYLGEKNSVLNVWIKNRPEWPYSPFPAQSTTLKADELNQLITNNSNHWRKVFNVYAKLLHALCPDKCNDWRDVRDQHLLQAGQLHGLTLGANLFQEPSKSISLICGKQYAEQLGLLKGALEVHPGIYSTTRPNVIIAPYFDYRALSNEKILVLAQEIMKLPLSSQTGTVLDY